MSNAKLVKLIICTVEGKDHSVTAQYNPKELGVEKSVTWSAVKTPTGDTPGLQFSAGSNRTMALELTFDGFEDHQDAKITAGTDVHAKYVTELIAMAKPMDETSSSDDQKRPPKVSVKWGDGKLPAFIGVIEGVSTKYTMFLPDGTPVRATCSVKLKEATSVSFKKGGT